MPAAPPRADCTAGNKSAIKTAMIAITTKSSIKVNARREIRSVITVSPVPFMSNCQRSANFRLRLCSAH